MSIVAERIKKSRKDAGLTQVRLSEILSVSKGTVAMWETGKREPNLDTFRRLGKVLDKKPEYLCGFTDEDAQRSSDKVQIIKGGKGR
jgi:transcriptional regulator with XRE-family HTH domain